MATQIPAKLLERIWFYTNFNCNLRCTYCVANSAPVAERPPLAWRTFRTLIDQAVALGFGQAVLTGGEPFLHHDIMAMIDHATARLETVVLTNAIPLTPAALRYLHGVNRDRLEFQVSLDSATPEVHDRTRGAGSWQKTMRGLRLLLDQGFRVSVRATLAGQNNGDLAALTQFLASLGIPEERVYSSPVVRLGRATAGLDLSAEDLAPEPTVAADGLYWHPLLIDPSLAVAKEIVPLAPGVEIMADKVTCGGAPARNAYQ